MDFLTFDKAHICQITVDTAKHTLLCASVLFFFFSGLNAKKKNTQLQYSEWQLYVVMLTFFFFFFVSPIYFFYSCAQNCMKIIYFFHKATLKQHLSRKLYFKVYMVIDRLFKLEVLAKCWLL